MENNWRLIQGGGGDAVPPVVSGETLVQRMAEWFQTYAVISKPQAILLTLWAIHTWVYDRFAATPYLEIMARTKRGGKTTVGELLQMVCRNAKMQATIRPLMIVRMIEAYEGELTVIIDEAEKLREATLNETRTLLATGYRRGQTHAISVGAKFKEFSTYCPKAFLLIGNLQDILRDRSIPIYLERGTPAKLLTNNREVAEGQADELVLMLREVFKALTLKRGTDGKVRFDIVDPVWLHSARDREIWTPIFSIAAALQLHKETVDTLQAASVDFSALKQLAPYSYHSAQDEQQADDVGASDALLRDVASVLRDDEEPNIATADLLARLKDIKIAPWRSYKGDGLNAITLASLLIRFGLQPDARQFGKGRKDRRILSGYIVKDIRKAYSASQK